MINHAIVTLGSNIDGGDALLARVVEGLKGITVRATGRYSDSNGYVNVVMEVATTLGHDELRAAFKEMERAEGRLPSMKELGVVPLDVDIVVYNGEVMRPADYGQAYFRKGMSLLGAETTRRPAAASSSSIK